MKDKRKLYNIISLALLLVSIIVLSIIDKSNNILLSIIFQIIFIAYLIKLIYGSILYIKKQYSERKYSYSIIMNLGFMLFLFINLIRQVNLLIFNWKITNINDIYINTLNSFSYFSYIVLPFIIILGIYSIVTNIILIIKEKVRLQNLLGIIFGIIVILGTISGRYIYQFTNTLQFMDSQLFIKKFIDIGLNAILSYFYCITLATIYCNVMASKHIPNFDKDFVIVLGSKINDDGTLTPLLKARVDKAIEFANNQEKKSGKKIIFIPSGGKGEDEVISEAEAMKNYLIENNVKPEDIIIENKSTNTLQNIKFSKEKIDEINKNGKIIFSTTNYHVFRSGVIANNEGIDCEGIGSKTTWYFYTNALIREFFANIVNQKKQHLIIVSLINLSIFVLLLIGFHFNLI